MKMYDNNRNDENYEDEITGLSKETFAAADLWYTDWTTETLISQLNKGNIELDTTFQRRDAWQNDRKSKFIESMFLNLPIPQIILAERKDKKGSFIVIDGKQRLLTIKKFSIPPENDNFKPLKLSKLTILKDLNGKNYHEIKEAEDLSDYIPAFENHTIRTVIIRNWLNEIYLYTIFLRLNSGRLSLSPQETSASRFVTRINN